MFKVLKKIQGYNCETVSSIMHKILESNVYKKIYKICYVSFIFQNFEKNF